MPRHTNHINCLTTIAANILKYDCEFVDAIYAADIVFNYSSILLKSPPPIQDIVKTSTADHIFCLDDLCKWQHNKLKVAPHIF